MIERARCVQNTAAGETPRAIGVCGRDAAGDKVAGERGEARRC